MIDHARLISRTRRWAGCGVALLFTCGAVAGEFECLIEPRQVVELKAPVEGLIERVYVDRGDFVEKGQVLVELDAGVDKARLELARFKAEMKGAVRAAESRVEFAAKKLQRQQDLHQRNFVSTNERDEAATALDLAQADLLEAHDNQQLAQLEVRQDQEIVRLKTIRSPFSGVVTERLHHPGEVAQGGVDRLPIVKLAELDPLYVEVVLPVEALDKIKVGDPVEVIPTKPVGGKFTARVKVVDRVVEAASSTFGVRLELPNPGYRIPAGIRCTAVFPAIEFDDQALTPGKRKPRAE